MLWFLKNTRVFLCRDSHKFVFFAFFGNYFDKVRNGHLWNVQNHYLSHINPGDYNIFNPGNYGSMELFLDIYYALNKSIILLKIYYYYSVKY